jgi:hypothetical protein
MISEGRGMQALSMAIRRITPAYPPEEMMAMIKDAKISIIQAIILGKSKG